MSDVHLVVDLPHPPKMVWMALTLPAHRDRWFVPTDLTAVKGGEYRMSPPAGLAGFRGPLTVTVNDVLRLNRLAMTWDGPQRRTSVTWQLQPSGDGTRLEMTESGFFGIDGGVQRAELRGTYRELLAAALPLALNDMRPTRSRRSPHQPVDLDDPQDPHDDVRDDGPGGSGDDDQPVGAHRAAGRAAGWLPDQRVTKAAVTEAVNDLLRRGALWPLGRQQQRHVRNGASVAIGLVIAASLGGLTALPATADSPDFSPSSPLHSDPLPNPADALQP